MLVREKLLVRTAVDPRGLRDTMTGVPVPPDRLPSLSVNYNAEGNQSKPNKKSDLDRVASIRVGKKNVLSKT